MKQWKRRFHIFFSIVEIKTKAISMVTFFSAVVFVLFRQGELPVNLFVFMFAAVLMVDMGTTAFNHYFDYRSGVDTPLYSKDKDKILMLGNVEAFTALHIALALFLGAAVLGIIITVLAGFWVLPAGAASMAVGYLYNGGPKPISRTPFGEIFAGGFLGSVLFLITFSVFTGELSGAAVLVSLPFALIVGSVLLVNNTCDMVGDRVAGRKTLALVVGRPVAETSIYLAGAAAYGLGFYAVYKNYLPETFLFSLTAAGILSVLVFVLMHRKGYHRDSKVANIKSIVALYVVYGLQFIAALTAAMLSEGLPVQ